MHSNGTLPLDAPLDAWCVYTLKYVSFYFSEHILLKFQNNFSFKKLLLDISEVMYARTL